MDENYNSLGDVFISIADDYANIGKKIKSYEESQKFNNLKAETEKLYSINEVMNIYPQLSKHILTNAINAGLLSVTKIGIHRHFYIKDIEEYLQSKTTKFDMSAELNALRNNG